MAAGKFSACLADLHRETEEPQVRGHPGDQCEGLSHSLDTVLGPGKHSPVSRAGLSLGASLNEPWGSYWGGGERDCFAPPPQTQARLSTRCAPGATLPKAEPRAGDAGCPAPDGGL